MKTKAVICDLDGTLFNIEHRKAYIDGSLGSKNWDVFYSECVNDEPNEWCKDLIQIIILSATEVTYIDECRVIFVTGRPEKIRRVTGNSIREKIGLLDFDFDLYMRKEGDFRKDSIIKKEIYENEIKEKYDVLFCLEDRTQVVEMWRSIGLVCLQCDKGDF